MADKVVSFTSCKADFSVISCYEFRTKPTFFRAVPKGPRRHETTRVRNSPSLKETIVKRVLLVLGTAVLFMSTFVTPSLALFDGGSGGTTNCGATLCKP